MQISCPQLTSCFTLIANGYCRSPIQTQHMRISANIRTVHWHCSTSHSTTLYGYTKNLQSSLTAAWRTWRLHKTEPLQPENFETWNERRWVIMGGHLVINMLVGFSTSATSVLRPAIKQIQSTQNTPTSSVWQCLALQQRLCQYCLSADDQSRHLARSTTVWQFWASLCNYASRASAKQISSSVPTNPL